jgi:SulP family sulfate permease
VDHIGLLSDSTAKIFDEFDEALEWIEDETLALAGHAHVSHEGIPLGKFEIFHGLNDEEIAALERCAQRHVYEAGDLVFSADSGGHELMLISRGEVKVSLPLANGKTIHLTTFSRGQFFGEMSFLDGRAHSADVYATRETELIAIDRKAFATVAAGASASCVRWLWRLPTACAMPTQSCERCVRLDAVYLAGGRYIAQILLPAGSRK